MKRLLNRLWSEEAGQDLIEYALLLTLISLASVASFSALAGSINTVFSSAVTNMAAVAGS